MIYWSCSYDTRLVVEVIVQTQRCKEAIPTMEKLSKGLIHADDSLKTTREELRDSEEKAAETRQKFAAGNG